MKNIEVEIRSFITEEQYKSLIERFKEEADFVGEDEQITYYLTRSTRLSVNRSTEVLTTRSPEQSRRIDSEQDLRIQKNNNFSKIWLKKGKIHDEHREELEIKFNREDFEKLEKMFLTLSFNVEIKWFRKRLTFKWDDIDLTLDYTKGYGYIIELEKMSAEENKEETLNYLKTKMQEIGISLTPKEEFDKKYQYYKENWKRLV